MADRGTIEYRLKELEKKRDKYYNEYQQGGSPSSYKTFEKYDDLCEICISALRQTEEEDSNKKRKHININAYIEKVKERETYHRGITYTTAEVVEMLEDVKWL